MTNRTLQHTDEPFSTDFRNGSSYQKEYILNCVSPSMRDSPAEDSFRYALDPELLKLYGVTVLGYFIAVSAQNAFHIIANDEP